MDPIIFCVKNHAMPKEKNYKWKLGFFAVTTLIVAIGAIYYIGKQKNKFGSVFRLIVLFHSVTVLKLGSNVRLVGIDIGTVMYNALGTNTSVQLLMLLHMKIL